MPLSVLNICKAEARDLQLTQYQHHLKVEQVGKERVMWNHSLKEVELEMCPKVWVWLRTPEMLCA